jgi:hypothetical protein
VLVEKTGLILLQLQRITVRVVTPGGIVYHVAG